MSGMTPLIVGNWKMNGLSASIAQVTELGDRLRQTPHRADVVICPPATLLATLTAAAAPFGIRTGGQDCHFRVKGPHTGDLSAQMLADAGASYAIAGHSERRADHTETDALVRAKAEAAIDAELVPIICVGETEGERSRGEAVEVVARQLLGSVPQVASEKPVVIGYEPIWAIGTGITPTLDDIAQMHGTLRRLLVDRFGEPGRAIRLLYGGSMKPQNAKAILAVPEVNGGLIGGASLLASDFYAIISAT
jgi:triosephosphate isomerase